MSYDIYALNLFDLKFSFLPNIKNIKVNCSIFQKPQKVKDQLEKKFFYKHKILNIIKKRSQLQTLLVSEVMSGTTLLSLKPSFSSQFLVLIKW